MIREDSTSLAQDLLKEMDRSNINSLLALTRKLGVLPNHFDHGLNTYYVWQICFFHNMYPDKIDEVWNQMLPFIEQAYFAGKIGDGLFRLYDFQLNQLFGYQYYGFIADVPVKDEAHLQDRKHKYGFH